MSLLFSSSPFISGLLKVVKGACETLGASALCSLVLMVATCHVLTVSVCLFPRQVEPRSRAAGAGPHPPARAVQTHSVSRLSNPSSNPSINPSLFTPRYGLS